MASGTVHIRVPKGLHARPGHVIVQVAQRFQSTITLQRADRDFTATATSLMDVLMLGAEENSTLWIRAEGPDAEDALRALQRALVDLAGP